MQAEKAAPAAHLPPRNKEEGGREGGRRIMTIKKQKNGRSRDRLFVYKQKRDQEKERERERVPSHRFLHPGGTINNHLRSDPKHFWGRNLHILVIIDAAAARTTTADNEGSRHTFRYLHCRRRSHKRLATKTTATG
jgi:hypothetical protein